MAKIILKSPYFKPNANKNIGNYIRYIATRKGAEKSENTERKLPAFEKQKKIINSLIKKHPDAKDLFEYKDYVNSPTRKNAEELIMRVAETHGELTYEREKYVNYIAERPRVEKISSHGLFTDECIPIVLSQVAKEVAECPSNVWTHIISLHREDAERLGYNSVNEWMTLLRGKRNDIAKAMKIEPENFRWYAAFHNESHHPHVHMIAYSIKPGEAYLNEKGITEIKESLAKSIFRQDLFSIYKQYNATRNDLRGRWREMMKEIVFQINSEAYENKVIENMLLQLCDNLSNTSGKKQYGYLKADIKRLIDNIVTEFSNEPRIARLYDLWYKQKEAIIKIYTDELPERIPLVNNPEFRTIKNSIIKETINLISQKDFISTDIRGHTQNFYNSNDGTQAITASVICLLHEISKLFYNNDNNHLNAKIDKKQRKQINGKKQAQGLRVFQYL